MKNESPAPKQETPKERAKNTKTIQALVSLKTKSKVEKQKCALAS